MGYLAAFFKSASDAVDRVATFLLASFIGILGLVIMVSVFFRFVIHLPLAWTEDVSRAMMVWISFMGSSAAMKRGMHIALGLVQDNLSPRLRKSVQITCSLLILAFLVVAFWLGLRSSIRQWGQTATYFEIPITYIYGSAPLSMAFMILHSVSDILGRLTGKAEVGGENAVPQVGAI